jgi:hypothetical protein
MDWQDDSGYWRRLDEVASRRLAARGILDPRLANPREADVDKLYDMCRSFDMQMATELRSMLPRGG